MSPVTCTQELQASPIALVALSQHDDRIRFLWIVDDQLSPWKQAPDQDDRRCHCYCRNRILWNDTMTDPGRCCVYWRMCATHRWKPLQTIWSIRLFCHLAIRCHCLKVADRQSG